MHKIIYTFVAFLFIVASCGLLDVEEGTFQFDKEESRNLKADFNIASLEVVKKEEGKYELSFYDADKKLLRTASALNYKSMGIGIDQDNNGVLEDAEAIEIFNFAAGNVVFTQNDEGTIRQAMFVKQE